jgi:predicted MPP superfamily phosphohydrolase
MVIAVWLTVLVLVSVFVCIAVQTLWIKRSHYQLNGPAEASFKVVQLSDLHGRIRFMNGSLSHIVNKANPDYVMITGDLVSKRSQLNKVLTEIRKIDCPHIYFVPGNYEREGLDGFRKRLYTRQEYDDIIRSIEELSIVVLSNRGVPIGRDEANCLLYGFDNSIYGNERLTLNVSEIAGYDYVILLAHSPSIIDLVRKRRLPFDLLLAGHTHGGQIRLFGRTIGTYKNFHVGLQQLDRCSYFFIHRGSGTVKVPVRIACFPEIAVFEIAG